MHATFWDVLSIHLNSLVQKVTKVKIPICKCYALKKLFVHFILQKININIKIFSQHLFKPEYRISGKNSTILLVCPRYGTNCPRVCKYGNHAKICLFCNFALLAICKYCCCYWCCYEAIGLKRDHIRNQLL